MESGLSSEDPLMECLHCKGQMERGTDIERIVDAAERRLRDEMHSGFDAITQRLDTLIEARLDSKDLPRRLNDELPEHDVRTVPEARLEGS